jgi:nucleoside-diphosphate-sugar epimerase
MDPVAQCKFAPLFEKRSILVLGAGYVGYELACLGHRNGAYVTALTRNIEYAEKLRQEGVKVIVDDLAQNSWHKKAGKKLDAVFVCVGASSPDAAGYRHSYIDGLSSVSCWLAACEAGFFAYTSSTSVYSQTPGTDVDEDSVVQRERMNETAALLLEAEEIVLNSLTQVERRCVLRLAGLYGPGRHRILDQVNQGLEELPGAADQHLNLLHRDDAVDALLSAWAGAEQTREKRLFNVVDDGGATRGEIVEWLALRLGRAVPRFSGTKTHRGGADRIVSNSRMKHLLKWAPRYGSFREGYEEIIRSETL